MKPRSQLTYTQHNGWEGLVNNFERLTIRPQNTHAYSIISQMKEKVTNAEFIRIYSKISNVKGHKLFKNFEMTQNQKMNSS